MSLTVLKIKNAKPKEKKYKLYDSDYLYLEVYPSGNKRWIYYYKKIKTISIGKYPILGLKEARLKRNEIKRQILLYGLDEYLARQKNIKLQPKREFENIVKEWFIIYKKGKTQSTISTALKRLKKHILPAFKGKDISKITIKEIYALLKKTEKPTARKLKSLLSGIFNYAVSKEYIRHNIIKDIDLSQLFYTSVSENYPYTNNLDEVKIYYNAVKDISDRPIVKGAIKIIWLTALRQGSVRAIKWEHIDFNNKVLFIPRENLKIKAVDFKIPLSDEALKTFKELKKIKNSDYVFYSSRNPNNHISEAAIRKFQIDISNKYNIAYQSLHGIRHTFSTLTRNYLQEKHNIKDEVIEIALQHLDKNQIRATYNHYDYFKERKELLDLWTDFLNNL